MVRLKFIICGLLLVSSCASIRPRYHTVESGDTFAKIGRKYNVDVKPLQMANSHIKGPKQLTVGEKLYIPYESSPQFMALTGIGQEFSTRMEGARELSSGGSFSWPVKGRLTSGFGRRGFRRHEGIDIAAPKGTLIRSARSGHVVYSGHRVRGYGNMVMLRHSDGYVSVYAHLQKRLVKKGQFVSRGEALGKMGSTGRSTGVHLHFEIRKGQKAVDPLPYLGSKLAQN